MSNHSGIRQVFALVGQLRDLARDFAAREEKLSADFRARTGAETKAFETASTAQAARAAEELSQAETGFRQRHERLRRHFELRKKRINQAHIASRARAMDAIRDNEGRSKYKVQEGTLNAERRRDAELSAASARFDEFSSTLASESIQLRELELRALASLGGYSSQLRRELDPATRASSSSSSHPESSQDEAGLLVELQKDHEQIEKEIASFRKRLPAGVGKHLPLWISFLLMSAGIALLVPPVQSALGPEFPSRIIGAALVGIAVIVATIRLAGQRQAVPAAGKLGRLIAHARELHEAADAQNRGHLALDQQRAAAGFEEAKRQINSKR